MVFNVGIGSYRALNATIGAHIDSFSLSLTLYVSLFQTLYLSTFFSLSHTHKHTLSLSNTHIGRRMTRISTMTSISTITESTQFDIDTDIFK